MADKIFTNYEGRRLKLTNLDKVIYPTVGITKAEIIQYYISVAEHLLDYIRERPLTLIRFPNGIKKASFYTKQKPDWTPEWIKHLEITHSTEAIKYLIPDELAIVPWLANLSALEIHPMQGRINSLEIPDFAVFDLDPPESLPFAKVKEIAFLLKVELEKLGYTPYVKTSGSKGLHVLIKLDEQETYEVIYKMLKSISADFVAKYPKKATGHLNKAKRGNRILIDIFRNHIHNTTVAAFSLRGKEGAPISWPISWDTLEDLESSQHYTIKNYEPHLDDAVAIMGEFYNSGTPRDSFPERGKRKPLALSKHPKHMLASQETKPPTMAKYDFEIKWDGIRVFVINQADETKIYSRSGRDISSSFPDVIEQFDSHYLADSVIDGELVCINAQGIPAFGDIISRMHSKNPAAVKKKKPATFYAFDILYHNGNDVKKRQLKDRRALLKSSLIQNDRIKYSESFADRQALFDAGKGTGLEGIMAKDRFSVYQEDQRSAAWVKIKYRNRASCAIIGYTQGQGDRAGLPGSFHLIEYVEDSFLYRGRVGTGFDRDKLKKLQEILQPSVTDRKPISQKIEEEKNSVWVSEYLHCEIEYASITSNDTFREPVFIKIIDKKTT